MEITINAKQIIAMVWTVVAIVVSLIVVLGVGFPYAPHDGVPYMMVAAFFGVLLVITLPVYLLIAVWGMASKSASE